MATTGVNVFFFLFRTNIAAARLAGLEDDLKLNASGTQYSVSCILHIIYEVLFSFALT